MKRSTKIAAGIGLFAVAGVALAMGTSDSAEPFGGFGGSSIAGQDEGLIAKDDPAPVFNFTMAAAEQNDPFGTSSIANDSLTTKKAANTVPNSYTIGSQTAYTPNLSTASGPAVAIAGKIYEPNFTDREHGPVYVAPPSTPSYTPVPSGSSQKSSMSSSGLNYTPVIRSSGGSSAAPATKKSENTAKPKFKINFPGFR